MKKIVILIVALVAVAGCTREQREKIGNFWLMQFLEISQHFGGDRAGNRKDLDEMLSKMAADANAADALAKTPEPVKAAPKPVAPQVAEEPIEAYLFLSNTCPWCRKLKESNFAAKFRRKYGDDFNLTEYEVSDPNAMKMYSKMIKKHHLQGGVPLLIIGDQVIHGYSDQMMALADEKVQIELKKRARTGASKPSGPAVVSITMEGDEISGPASAADKAKMKTYLAVSRENNEATLKSLNQMFPKSVWNQALVIISTTENNLKNAANTSATYQAFEVKAKSLNKKQQEQIDELIVQNASKIRNVR